MHYSMHYSIFTDYRHIIEKQFQSATDLVLSARKYISESRAAGGSNARDKSRDHADNIIASVETQLEERIEELTNAILVGMARMAHSAVSKHRIVFLRSFSRPFVESWFLGSYGVNPSTTEG